MLLAITDRRLMAPDPLDAIERLARIGGARVRILIREPDLPARALFDLARAAKARIGDAALSVSDRVDVARALEIGVHLSERALAPADARALLGALPIGCSRHDPVGAAEARGADYLTISPIFDSPGKGPARGLDLLRATKAAAPCAVLALGGIDRETAPLAWAAGADGVAAIRAAWAVSSSQDLRSLLDPRAPAPT